MIPRIAAAALAAAALAGCVTVRAPEPEPQSEPDRWWKGNLHTHSLWSDGDDYPEVVTAWYRDHGYHFLAISDHNTLAEGERWVDVERGSPAEAVFRRYVERYGPEWVLADSSSTALRVRLKTLEEYRPLFDDPGRFLIIQSEEITDRFGDKPLHVNATNVAEHIDPRGGGSVREVLQNNIDAVLEQRDRTGQPMFPHVNHPNFGWAVSVEDLMALEGEQFFEVYNGHPLVHNEGDHEHPSTERMWDLVLADRLARGRGPMYGLATDDAHHYQGWDARQANPGRGWVMVRAGALTAGDIIAALERGDFYASTGVQLRDVRREADRLSVEVEPEPGVDYTIQFIGTRRSAGSPEEVGVVLAERAGPHAVYQFAGDELYVRAKVISSEPKSGGVREDERELAWTQPLVPPRR